MKLKNIIMAASLFTLASCGLKEEFQPVFTGKYDAPAPYAFYTDSDFGNIITISELVSKYSQGKPAVMGAGNVIKGRVISTDKPGNFYKSFYIQDETGGIEIKVGKNCLYNDYLPGQNIYVDCNGLTLGCYGYKSGNYGGQGMVQLGFSDPSGSYETSYLEAPIIIEKHILRGNPNDIEQVEPYLISSPSMLPGKTATQATNKYVGSLVTLQELSYANEVFVLLYLNSQKDKSSFTNRVFLSSTNSSDPTCGITTLAMSKEKMKEYLLSGVWDGSKVGSGNSYATNEDGSIMTIGSLRGDGTYPGVEKAAYSVSHYFAMGSTQVQLRTSGFCKFADYEIPADILDGSRKVDITGVLTLYQGSVQLVVNSTEDFVYSDDGTPVFPK